MAHTGCTTIGGGTLAMLLLVPLAGCATSSPRPQAAPALRSAAAGVADLAQDARPHVAHAARQLARGLAGLGGLATRAGSRLGAGLVHWTPRVARAGADATVRGARELWSWGPPIARGSVAAVRELRRLRPQIDRVPEAPDGQDFLLGRTGVRVRQSVESFRAQRFRYVVPQQLDFSCGAAALATLFQYYYEEPVGEAEIIGEMLSRGDTDRIRREGFSLLDMKHYAEHRGYEAKGFRLETSVLERLAIPTVALVNTRGYAHFVVLKGARDGEVYLADPALGQRRVAVEEFEQEWTGVVLFVAKKRADDAFAPLEVLALNRPSPMEVVRDFDLLGIRPLVPNPREF